MLFHHRRDYTDRHSSNFEKKPPKRDYPDYYKMIDRPTSISDVKVMIRQGKVTDWDHLAKEVRLIWDNAKTYNEEGSPIYEMTEALEVRPTLTHNRLSLTFTDMV